MFKRHRDYGFWDRDIRLNELSQSGGPLEKLNKGLDFELFGTLFQENLSNRSEGSSGSRLRRIISIISVIKIGIKRAAGILFFYVKLFHCFVLHIF